MRGQAVKASPDTSFQALMRWMSHHQTTAASIILLSLLLLAGTTIGTLYQQQRNQARIQKKERQLGRFVSQVSEHSQFINNKLLNYISHIRALESSTRLLLQNPPTEQKYFLADDLKRATETQNHFPYIPTYAKKLSFEYPLLLSQQQPPNAYKLQQINALRLQLKDLLASSIATSQDELESFSSRNLMPITWIHVVLASGESLVYPGTLGLQADFDFRKENWYQMGLATPQSRWSKPHVDALGQGLVLSLTLPINFKASGTADGLISLDVSFQYLIDKLMRLNTPGVIQHYLINQQGEIVVRASDKNRLYGMRYGFVTGGKAIDTPLFDQSEVVEDIRASKSGFKTVS